MEQRRIPRVVLLVLATLLIVGLASWFWGLMRSHKAPTELVLYGNVDIRQVELAFNGQERIATMSAREGERVHKGQLLATLDRQRLEYTVAQAKAQAAAQQEIVARLEAGSRPEEIRQAKSAVQAAEADANIAERTARRLASLVASSAVSRQQADEAAASAKLTKARLQEAREALKLALAGPRQEDIAAAKATLQAYEAALGLAEKQLTDANLYAPVDGVIQDRLLEPGDMASPSRPVYTVALDESLWVRTYVSVPDLGKVRLGMAALVSTDSYPAKRYRGWVGYISPTSEFTPKAVETTEVRTSLVHQLRVYICDGQGDELRLGMPATVSIPLTQADSSRPLGANPCGKQ